MDTHTAWAIQLCCTTLSDPAHGSEIPQPAQALCSQCSSTEHLHHPGDQLWLPAWNSAFQHLVTMNYWIIISRETQDVFYHYEDFSLVHVLQIICHLGDVNRHLLNLWVLTTVNISTVFMQNKIWEISRRHKLTVVLETKSHHCLPYQYF